MKSRTRVLKWDTLIEEKTIELGRFLTGKSSSLDLAEPAPTLEKQDGHDLRAKILALSTHQAMQLGIGRSTLHYLRNNAGSMHSFNVSRKVRGRLFTTT